MTILLRNMCEADIQSVIRIQAEAYVNDMLEPENIIRARFHSTLETSWVAENKGQVIGYLVGYKSTLACVTSWGDAFIHAPEANTIYLHDLAIGLAAKGMGLGKLLVNHALNQLNDHLLVHAALVSVQQSKMYWEKLGFLEYSALDETQTKNLASYAGPAFYMVRVLG